MIKYYCDNPECGVEIKVNESAKRLVLKEIVGSPTSPIQHVSMPYEKCFKFEFCYDCYGKFDNLTKQDIIKRLVG